MIHCSIHLHLIIYLITCYFWIHHGIHVHFLKTHVHSHIFHITVHFHHIVHHRHPLEVFELCKWWMHMISTFSDKNQGRFCTVFRRLKIIILNIFLMAC